MDKFTINLLPQQIQLDAALVKRKSKLIKISIAFLVLLIVITASALFFSIVQQQDIKNVDNKISQSTVAIGTYKEKEGLVTLLKDRLETIKTVNKKEYLVGSIYLLFSSLVPEDIKLSQLGVSRDNAVGANGSTVSTASLRLLFNNLIDPQKVANKFGPISIDSLSKGEKGISFTLKTKSSTTTSSTNGPLPPPTSTGGKKWVNK